jgi:hypothetical protein
MGDPLQRLMMLPVPARIVVLSLLLLPPASLYVSAELRDWALAGSPAYPLTDRFFWALGAGRMLGAVLLAILLLYWRRPASLATAITTVWMAGPPLTFLWRGIVVLAASLGQSSWGRRPSKLASASGDISCLCHGGPARPSERATRLRRLLNVCSPSNGRSHGSLAEGLLTPRSGACQTRLL